ncbi:MULTISPECIES: signal peptidase II [Enterococcus]|uniref:signal peptidase II n=1 Tax=Enterococcus TaxID=1350 RepID=UPI0001B1E149|nr:MULTISPECIES: signal peptidase II [Enterococcus]EET99187.1 prolipoprotein signal peptidase [Enterococcus faecalis T2]EEU23598.1 prolipoprotein signal peptidase [Enterococcus faecalis T3]EEU68902.1 prolipoprotein signal peptidase [Enterococcus faecalis Merz96]KLL29218.1 lipoprotein signal peptidase [Streptococcus agalactiae]AIL03315.1 signal peptidase II [Enterococcus faecalis ATCC 29212]
MLVVYFLISALLVGLDQWSKYLTVQNISLGETKEFIPGFLSLTHLRNTGAAWSLLEGKMIFFYVITVIVSVVIIYLLIKNYKKSIWYSVGLSFVLAGAIGNFIDRVRLGYVVDMLQTDFMNFPIFNVADSTLVVGVICIFIYLILDEKAAKEGKNGTN